MRNSTRAGAVRLVMVIVLGTALAACGVTSLSSSGIGHPGGPTLAALGYAERCQPRDSSCTDAATARLREALMRLGGSVEGMSVTDPDSPAGEGILLVTVDSDPPFEWRTVDGDAGTSRRVAVDLTFAQQPGVVPAYVVVAPERAFVLEEADARTILDALFVPAP